MTAAAQMLCGGALMLVAGWLLGERFTAVPTLHGTLSVVYLALFGSILAFSAYAWLLQNVRATLAGSYAYVNPLIAVLLGAWLAGERFGPHDLGAMAVVLAGVVAGAASHALRGVLCILPTMAHARPRLVMAVAALVLYVLFVLASLSGIGATLTLPGIAGLILSVGMAVDANVLIFERIREELALGRSARIAVNEGFGNALSAIVDAQLTTLLTAFVLFQFGTGPVQGFAVTLAIGIVASMFTAIFITRTFFMLYLERRVALGEAIAAPGAETSPPPSPSADEPFIDLDQPLKSAREEWNSIFETRYLGALLARHGNNVSAAARAAGVNRVHLYRLLRKYGLRDSDHGS